jgi:hypothetical protein
MVQEASLRMQIYAGELALAYHFIQDCSGQAHACP